MLDPYDCDTTLVELFNDLDEFARFGIGQTAANFVEQKDLGARRERARKLKTLAIEQGKVSAWRLARLQSCRKAQGIRCNSDRRRSPFTAPAGGGGDVYILEDVHAAEGPWNLVGSSNS